MGEFKGMTKDDLKQRMGILDAELEHLRGEEKIAFEQLIIEGKNLDEQLIIEGKNLDETKQSENKYIQAGEEFEQLGEKIAEKEAYKEALQFLINKYSVLKTRYDQIDIKNDDELQDWVNYFEKYYSDAVNDVHDFFLCWTQLWTLHHPVDQGPEWGKYSYKTNMRVIEQLNEQLERFLELKNHKPGNSGFPDKTDSDTEPPNKHPRNQLLQKPLIRF